MENYSQEEIQNLQDSLYVIKKLVGGRLNSLGIFWILQSKVSEILKHMYQR